jgi:hypothetical protein
VLRIARDPNRLTARSAAGIFADVDATRESRRAGARRLAFALVLGGAGALASPVEPRAAKVACEGAVYEVLGESLLDGRAGDAIRLGAESVAVRSGCEDVAMRLDVTRTGEQVLRGLSTDCAVDGASVSLWVKVRADCSKAVGRVAVLPERRLRLFEAVRVADDFAAPWPRPCACEPRDEAPTCERDAFADC